MREHLIPGDEPTNIKQLVLETNPNSIPQYGFYRGIIVQNNDPERRGRVKIFVPSFSPQIYDNWYKNRFTDKSFRFPAGQNIYTDKESLKQIINQVKEVLPWAEQAAPLVGAGSSGIYDAKNDVASISDSTTSRTPSPASEGNLNVDGIGEKEGFIFETPQGQLNDGFVSYNADQMPEVNPYAFQYRPSTYSNCAKGFFTIPDVGAHVWVFFDNGLIEKPIYFAYTYSKYDWQNINEMLGTQEPNAGINYPDAFENAAEQDTYKKGKQVFVSKAGTLEFIDTDDNESVKLTHASGSFTQMHKLATTQLVTGNDQKLVLKSQFETIRGTKNIHVSQGFNIGVDESCWTRIGDWKNVDSFRAWQDLNRPIADIRTRFPIKRTQALIEEQGVILSANSIGQVQSGSFARNPVLSERIVAASSSSVDDDIYKTVPIASTQRGNQASSLSTAKPSVSSANNQRAPTSITANEFAAAAGPSGSNNFTGTNASLSPSTKDGVWDVDADYINISNLETAQAERMIELEKKFGVGGDDNVEVLRHKCDIIGAVFNDAPSIRVDRVGRIDFNEMLISPSAAFASQKPSPLVERVANDGKFPCGNYTLTVCNAFTINTGAGGIRINTVGNFDITGRHIVVAAANEALISSGGDTKIVSQNRLELEADIIVLKQRDRKQVGIDGSLGVRQNIIIGGGAYVEGELYVNHISAPAEIQETEETQLYGRTNNEMQKVIGFVNVDGQWQAVYSCVPSQALFSDADSIINAPHSHNFRNIPLSLYADNRSMRASATNMNTGVAAQPATPVQHGKKTIISQKSSASAPAD